MCSRVATKAPRAAAEGSREGGRRAPRENEGDTKEALRQEGQGRPTQAPAPAVNMNIGMLSIIIACCTCRLFFLRYGCAVNMRQDVLQTHLSPSNKGGDTLVSANGFVPIRIARATCCGVLCRLVWASFR